MSYETDKQLKFSIKIDINMIKFRMRSITNNNFEGGGSYFNLCSGLGRRSRNNFVRVVSLIIDSWS